MGIYGDMENQPGIVLSSFHDESVKQGAYSLITLQMAGYVAKDKNGTVAENETAPSGRWAMCSPRKESGFVLQPDTSDNNVYMDEMVNFLISKYGLSTSNNGVKGYALDNEPCLWSSTHPRIHKNPVRCDELISRSIELSKAVKDLDANAEIFGPVLYGFNAYINLQNAPDWDRYQDQYPRFIDFYLDKMKKASDSLNVRLLDVLDVHWYPDIEVLKNGTESREAYYQRMQAPRSLWDSTYKEDSWIGQWFSPVAILRYLNSSIEQNFPETKLAITEYDYGGVSHISGGIAQADALGIFGKYGVYFASKWGEYTGFINSAFRLFCNYNGFGGCYGDILVNSFTDNYENSSVYTSINSKDTNELHIILINKNQDSSVIINATINSSKLYTTGENYFFTSEGFDLNSGILSENQLKDNVLAYSLPPMSVHHLILKADKPSDVEDLITDDFTDAQIYPNPCKSTAELIYSLSGNKHLIIVLSDYLGRDVKTLLNENQSAGKHCLVLNFNENGINLADGIYFIRLITDNKATCKYFVISGLN
jgi:mannan endo-1,4-beta-mannosidase